MRKSAHEKTVALLPPVCYNKNQANRILEYPGRRFCCTEAIYTGVGRFYPGMGESFRAFLFAGKQSQLWRKIGG